jgi:hypothetical protein
MHLGYAVIEADCAAAAISVMDIEKIDLLFTDVVMPGEPDGLAWRGTLSIVGRASVSCSRPVSS